MTTPKFQGYLIILYPDDGNEIIRAFKRERTAVEFVGQEHLRRWDTETDAWRAGLSFESASLYYFDLKGTRLRDTYSTDALENGDAEGWGDKGRNKISESAITIANYADYFRQIT